MCPAWTDRQQGMARWYDQEKGWGYLHKVSVKEEGGAVGGMGQVDDVVMEVVDGVEGMEGGGGFEARV